MANFVSASGEAWEHNNQPLGPPAPAAATKPAVAVNMFAGLPPPKPQTLKQLPRKKLKTLKKQQEYAAAEMPVPAAPAPAGFDCAVCGERVVGQTVAQHEASTLHRFCRFQGHAPAQLLGPAGALASAAARAGRPGRVQGALQAGSVGYRLLQKAGWVEGGGLGPVGRE